MMRRTNRGQARGAHAGLEVEDVGPAVAPADDVAQVAQIEMGVAGLVHFAHEPFQIQEKGLGQAGLPDAVEMDQCFAFDEGLRQRGGPEPSAAGRNAGDAIEVDQRAGFPADEEAAERVRG